MAPIDPEHQFILEELHAIRMNQEKNTRRPVPQKGRSLSKRFRRLSSISKTFFDLLAKLSNAQLMFEFAAAEIGDSNCAAFSGTFDPVTLK
jgi:hypothetical protein